MKYTYDTRPEGEHCLQKTLLLGAYGAAAGAVLATYDVILYSHPANFAIAFGRYFKHMGMLSGAGAAFATTVCVSTQIRKKDDPHNYFFGGVAAAYTICAGVRNFKIAPPLCLITGFFAWVMKDAKVRGFNLFPDIQPQYGPYDHLKFDYTLSSDPKDYPKDN